MIHNFAPLTQEQHNALLAIDYMGAAMQALHNGADYAGPRCHIGSTAWMLHDSVVAGIHASVRRWLASIGITGTCADRAVRNLDTHMTGVGVLTRDDVIDCLHSA